MKRLLLFVVGLSLVTAIDRGSNLGCFKNIRVKETISSNVVALEDCLNNCETDYYRYAFVKTNLCGCGNFLGEKVNSTSNCNGDMGYVYTTGNQRPGPPTNFNVSNVTGSDVFLSWGEPQSYIDIISYQIKTNVLKTYSSYPPNNNEYIYSNNTFKTVLILQPATKYELTIQVKSSHGLGAPATNVIETEIGIPDNSPPMPTIIQNNGINMTIKVNPVVNNNGPITFYRIVVVNLDSKQGFQPDSLKSYNESLLDDSTYYIAAELDPKEIERNFVVGDGKVYGKYYNAPLTSKNNYNILSGIVSTFNGVTKYAYSNSSGTYKGILILDVNEDKLATDNSPFLIIGLSIAIGLLSVALAGGIIGFLLLRNRIVNRRQRLSVQELTLQGPMIEIENNAYIPEEEQMPVNHYKNLKQKVRILNLKNELKIDHNNVLGIGSFGKVSSATIQESDSLIPVAAYCIADKTLPPLEKKVMLKELDMLIRNGQHRNIVELIGTCESSQMLYVVFDLINTNLKEYILSSRESLTRRFSNISEFQVLDIAIQIAEGMAHFERCKVVHKQLCCRNIMLANGVVPKIGGYGLTHYNASNNIPDYTRWTAPEIFRGVTHNVKSDVWSFGCLLWEMCVLGGTPYGNIHNSDKIVDNITRGVRLPQTQYFGDDFYQIMLSCWQVDLDERPSFITLVKLLENCKESTIIPFLTFNLHANFQYEPYHPSLEVKSL